MELKKININDFNSYQEKIIELQKSSYLTSFQISENEALKLAKLKNVSLKKNLVENNCYLTGAIIKEHLVGFVWFFEIEYFKEKRLHINQIVVDPNYRRQGIAKTLLKEVEVNARSLNIDVLDLNVSESNENAINMYSHLNFGTERRRMKKRLVE